MNTVDTKKRSYDSTHYYAAQARATTVKAGSVFWNEPNQGWSFNVIIDGIAVRSNNRYPREGIAKEAMRLEVLSIETMLNRVGKPDSEASGITVTTENATKEQNYVTDNS